MNDGTSPHPAGSGDAGIHALSPSADKIALFRSLFQGRENVYPRRFESNEWGRGICEKPGLAGKAKENRLFNFRQLRTGVVDEAESPINHKTAASRAAIEVA